MTLDDRIKKDLDDLYNKGEIDGAVALDGLVQKENEGLYWVGDAKGTFTTDEKTVIELLKSNSGISIEQLAVQAQMEVKSLEALLKNLKKNKGCADNIKDKISFATRALPVYTGGKRGAKTVMVMLNPGKGVKASNNDLYIELKKRSMFTMLEKLCCGVNSGNANLDEDIENYHYFNTNYGDWDCNRHDNFDLKQAFFLRDWPKDSDVSLSQDNLKYIIENNKTEKKEVKEEVQKLKLEEKRKVLMNKQQLELVPYASRSFSSFADKDKIKELCPYVDTLLDEIFLQPREYVIFCSRLFNEVFEVYNAESKKNSCEYKVDFEPECKYQIIGKEVDKKTGMNKTLGTSCTPITIKKDNSSIKAIIANTFPNQALPNAYEKMAEYGKFCYEVYDRYTKFQGPIGDFKNVEYQNILNAMSYWKNNNEL